MQVPPRILYWLQFLGGTTVGLAISWILFSQLRWKIFEPPTPETIKTEARISNGNSSRLPATREQTRLLGLERTYSFPAVRVTQIELATNGSLPNFFQLYTQSPTLRVPWLAAMSSIFPAQAGHYQRLAADLQGDTASTSSVVASGLYFGTFANAVLHRSSLAELRGAFRAQLSAQTLDYSRLEFNEPLFSKALALEVFFLPVDRYTPLNWTGPQYFAASKDHPDYAPLTALSAIDPPMAFRQCESLRVPNSYITATHGIIPLAFQAWAESSLTAATDGWLQYTDLHTLILRWSIYSPGSLLDWMQNSKLEPEVKKTLHRSFGQCLALTQWNTLETLPLHKLSPEFLAGLFRGLCQIDPALAKAFLDARQTAGQIVDLQPSDHSLLAGELSYIDPAMAAEHFAKYVSLRVQTPGAPHQDFDALRASERIYNALVDKDPAAALDSANRLGASARASALVQLYKNYLLKHDREASAKTLQILHTLHDGAFRAAVVQGYGTQVSWDILEGHDIDGELKSVLQRTGKRIRGAMLPTLTK
jgi:hypothetical protein